MWQKEEGLGSRANLSPWASCSALTSSVPWGWQSCPLELPKAGLFLLFMSSKCHLLREAFHGQLLHLLYYSVLLL